MIRVLLADDQTLVREGLTLMLGLMADIEVVGAAADGEAALAVALEQRPDVALLDLRMPRVDGVEATRRLREQLPDLEVVVLTTYADDDLVVVMLGDHQPATIVSGDDAGHDVPVTIIAKDRAVLDAIGPWAWDRGLRPSDDAPVARMDTFRDDLLHAFGPAGQTGTARAGGR